MEIKSWDKPLKLEQDAEDILRETKPFQELMMMYSCAIKEVSTKLEVLNAEFSVRYKRNPISSIKSRVKSPVSIYNKLKRRGLPISINSVVDNLNDVAGIRVICSFIDDIYDIAGMLASQDDVTVVQIKDYIKNPKDNGYRSYHMILEIPVFFSQFRRIMRVEVQIRTIAMDFWASLEHQMRYKKNLEEDRAFDVIGKELFECAKIIEETDVRMQKIRDMIGEFTDPT